MTTVEQFGLVTMAPDQPRSRRWRRMSAEMVGVDLGDHQRHGGIHPRGPGVADHEVAGGGEGRLELRRHGGVERGEHQARSLARRAGLHLLAADVVRDGGVSRRQDAASP